MRAHILTLQLLAATFLGWAAQAQTLLNVDFGVGETSAKTGFAATGRATNDFWNQYSHYKPRFVPGTPPVPNGALSRLKFSDGADSAVSVAVANAPGVWGNTTGDAMYDNYMFAPNGSNLTVVVTGLDPGRYHFYLYGHADPDATSEMNSVFRLQSGGTNYGPLSTLSSAGWKAAQPWREEHQYVVFRDVTVDSRNPIVIDVAPGLNGVAVLNGLQIASRGSGPPRPAAPATTRAALGYTNLVFREVLYDGKISDTEARFAVTLDVESLTTNEISAPLFGGDVAVIPGPLPPELRIVRIAGEYRLVVSAPGNYRPRLDVVAKISRAEPWNQISFTGPAAAIASVTAQAPAGVEVQLLSGAPVDADKAKPGASSTKPSHIEGFLGQDRTVALRWQGKTTEISRKSLVTVDTTAFAQMTPTVIKFTTVLRYELLQASVPRLTLALPANQALTRLQGDQIRDWSVKRDGAMQLLTVEFVKPVEKNYTLTLFSEQSVDATPFNTALTPPQPLEVERESGSFTLAADDVTPEVESTTGLRQVNAATGTFAAYRFYGRPFALGLKIKRIEPVINTAARVTARLEETRLVIAHTLNLTVEKAGIYSAEFTPQPGFVVADVKGEGVDDWKVVDGKLRVSFGARVLGKRRLDVHLEQAQKSFLTNLVVQPLRLTGATKETAFAGAAGAAGIRVKTAELSGVREIPINQLPARTDELLAFTADQPDWKLTLAAERLPARIVAEVFNLMTVGDGLVGGSATVRYGIINQGVQEFRVRVPGHWKNVEFTGSNIRRKEIPPAAAGADTNYVVWNISLQDKAWGGYTLLVTYDYQFDPQKASLNVAGLHLLDVERETGSVAITTAASLKLAPHPAAEPLRVIDQTELAPSDRALITRPVLLAYRYTGGNFALQVDVNRHAEERVLDAVADRTQLTSVLTDAGEMLTQASFMVKNNDRQFQAFILPERANLWGAYVNNQPVKAERNGKELLVSLPRGLNRDVAFAVDLVYAEKLDALKARLWPQSVALVAPRTDVPNTYAEWELYVPENKRVTDFGGNMTVARGTTYDLRDAWTRFVEFYADLLREYGVAALVISLLVLLVGSLGVQARRKGLQGFVGVLVVFAIIAVLAGMLLPSLAKAKGKANRIKSVNSLKQIALAAKVFAGDHDGRFPNTFEEMMAELGTDKILTDPDSNQRYIYVGGGKPESDSNAILAYSPVDIGGRNVAFADGHVEMMSSTRFAEALQRDAILMAQLRTETAMLLARNSSGGVGGGGGGGGGGGNPPPPPAPPMSYPDGSAAGVATLKFAQTNFVIAENGGAVTVTVVRPGALDGTVTVDYATDELAGGAKAGVKYAPTSGTLVFGPGERSKTFTVPVKANGKVETNELFAVYLDNPTGGARLAENANATVTILDIQRGSVDATFGPGIGADGSRYGVALRTNSTRAENFVAVDGRGAPALDAMGLPVLPNQEATVFSLASPNHVVAVTDSGVDAVGTANALRFPNQQRTMTDARVSGSKGDVSVNYGTADGTAVSGTTLGDDPPQLTRKVVIGGQFTTVNGEARNGIARMNVNGALDTSFNPQHGYSIAGVVVTNATLMYDSGVDTDFAARASMFASATALRNANVTFSLGSSGGPLPSAAGIRSIRIDIPRSGQAFMFTKVLNLSGEALAVQMSVMNYGSFRTARSVVQLLCFIVGLILVWVQWRNPDRNSLWFAIGVVLATGSVTNLLISGRVLHYAFITAVPAFVLTMLLLGIRRLWRSRGSKPPTDSGSGGDLGGGDKSVIAPAAAVLVFVILLILTASASAQSATRNAQSAITISSATYTGVVRERTAQFDATLQLHSVVTNAQTVPLFGADVAVAGFTVKAGDAKLVREGSSVGLLLTNRGDVTLEMKLLVKLGGDGTRRRLEFALPSALSSRLTATIEEPDADVEFPSAVAFKRATAAQQTQVEAIVGASDRVEMQWTPRMKRIEDMDATVFSQSSTVVTLGAGVVNTRSVLDYTVAQGELRQAKVRLPAGQRLLRVEGEWIRTWEIVTEPAGEILLVDLIKGVSPGWRLTVETERVLGTLPATVKVEVPHATEVKRETGLVAVRATEELALTVEGGAELQRVDTEEFLRVAKEKVADVNSAYRYLKMDFNLTARAEAVQPQIEAVVRNHLSIGADQLRLSAAIDYNIKKAGVFMLKVAVPAGWKVESVTSDVQRPGRRAAAPLVWNEKKETGEVEVNLPERTSGPWALRLELTQTMKDLPKSLTVPAVHPLGTEKLTGYVSVASEAGVSVKTATFDGLTEIPVTMIPARPGFTLVQPKGGAQSGLLAFKFITSEPGTAAAWKLSVATEQVESWVRAEVVNLITVSETLVSGRALLRYDIANAPVKEFQLKVPAGYTNIEITGVNIRRRDSTGEVWRVELQNKVRGTHDLMVTWEQPRARTNTTLDLPGVQAVGVERETGSVAILARPPLQVVEKGASAELVKVDPRELPEWAGPAATASADTVVLAYRYLRPGFQLSVASRRFDQAELLQTLVETVKLTTVVADDGQLMTELSLAVRNNGRQFLELELPANSKVWSAFVNGQPVRPSKQGGKLLLPLEKSGAEEAAIPVEVIYVGAEKFPKGKGAVALTSPTLDAPFKNARWEVYLPRDYEFQNFGGTMAHEAAESPVMQVFSAAAYGLLESKSRKAREYESVSVVSNVREQLKRGNVREAGEALSQARSITWGGEQAGKDLKALETEVKRAQSSSLINAQRDYSARNSGVMINDDDAPLGFTTSNYIVIDNEAVEQQVTKLQRQQEIAVAKVQPLHVNLPTHGQKIAFTQVLQTETKKAMTVRFDAHNTKDVSWLGRIFWSLGLFLALWIAASLLPRRAV